MIKYLFNHYGRSIIRKKAHVNIPKAFPPKRAKSISVWAKCKSKAPLQATGIKFVALQSSGVFDPRGSRQMCMQACLLGSLLAGIKERKTIWII